MTLRRQVSLGLLLPAFLDCPFGGFGIVCALALSRRPRLAGRPPPGQRPDVIDLPGWCRHGLRPKPSLVQQNPHNAIQQVALLKHALQRENPHSVKSVSEHLVGT
jgi:hypothetical protein